MMVDERGYEPSWLISSLVVLVFSWRCRPPLSDLARKLKKILMYTELWEDLLTELYTNDFPVSRRVDSSFALDYSYNLQIHWSIDGVTPKSIKQYDLSRAITSFGGTQFVDEAILLALAAYQPHS